MRIYIHPQVDRIGIQQSLKSKRKGLGGAAELTCSKKQYILLLCDRGTFSLPFSGRARAIVPCRRPGPLRRCASRITCSEIGFLTLMAFPFRAMQFFLEVRGRSLSPGPSLRSRDVETNPVTCLANQSKLKCFSPNELQFTKPDQ